MAKYQKFEVEIIHRSKIKNAPYNPRFIDDDARKRLKKGLKTYGLVSTLVWNKRTGNLVSGHQRLSIMDELENSDDYELSVSVVDIDLKEEMELNVQMNNASMMGDFDIDGLAMMADEGADINAMGFSDSDIDIMFGDSPLVELYEDNQSASEAKDTLKDIKKDRSEMMEKKKEDNSASYYFMVICENADEREELFSKMGVPFSEEIINASMLKRLS
nr:MAG TPA: ParB protein [Caudoviricetes sp.]